MLPFLLDSITAQAIAAQEDHLCGMAESLAQFGAVGCEAADDAIMHRHAVQLANEILWAHDSGLPADADLHHAATQLKLWHLTQIDNIVSKS
jgi:hypothetical protein